ncbi:tetracycline resistance protein, class H-like isoform X1 [Panicum miliaceum]|uniref:Tetracycline resistance protein, class H-like isoform X1 n=1 Tax=Panicum miliaceum TaxID=4540 RepID=A0A3L6SEU6_PANMI|nr:tetracycline resistance protein, class H-like isoform X1 [Panicum miliaceum]
MEEVAELGHLLVFAFLFCFAAFMVGPVITDVTMGALCPGRDECSLAIYLTGIQQAVTGLGALVLTPVVGNLSDRYGRKALLALPATASIVPLGILAYGRTRGYLYAYYITKTLTATVCEGSMMCLSLAYVADRVPEARRAAAFGVFSGVCSAGFVASAIAARFLPVSSTCQVAALAAVVTAVYMKAFLQETDSGASSCSYDEEASQPLCIPSSSEELSPKLPPLRKAPSLSEIAALLTSRHEERGTEVQNAAAAPVSHPQPRNAAAPASHLGSYSAPLQRRAAGRCRVAGCRRPLAKLNSSTFSRAAVVTFFHGLGDAGQLNTLLYFLKAKFHYSKNQYANLLLIIGITGSFSQLTVMPLLVPKLGEQKLLIIALTASCGHAFLYSIAWSFWVPYLAASCVILSMLVTPCIRSIISKKVGPFEQGMVQGCITGISSTANVISPLIFTPLTAWCLSEATPFYLKGFSLACAGFATLVALATSICMRPAEVQQPDRK